MVLTNWVAASVFVARSFPLAPANSPPRIVRRHVPGTRRSHAEERTRSLCIASAVLSRAPALRTIVVLVATRVIRMNLLRRFHPRHPLLMKEPSSRIRTCHRLQQIIRSHRRLWVSQRGRRGHPGQRTRYLILEFHHLPSHRSRQQIPREGHPPQLPLRRSRAACQAVSS